MTYSACVTKGNYTQVNIVNVLVLLCECMHAEKVRKVHMEPETSQEKCALYRQLLDAHYRLTASYEELLQILQNNSVVNLYYF